MHHETETSLIDYYKHSAAQNAPDARWAIKKSYENDTIMFPSNGSGNKA